MCTVPHYTHCNHFYTEWLTQLPAINESATEKTASTAMQKKLLNKKNKRILSTTMIKITIRTRNLYVLISSEHNGLFSVCTGARSQIMPAPATRRLNPPPVVNHIGK